MLLVLIWGGWNIPHKPTINIFGIIYGENLGLVNQLGVSLVTQLHWYIQLLDCATAFFLLKETGSTTSSLSTCVTMESLCIS